MKNHKQSFAYAFTKYEKNDIQNIHGRFNILLKTIQDPLAKDLIIDILEKTRKEINIISPLTDDPKDILHKMLEITPIYDPKNVFNCFLTEESWTRINNQIDIHIKDIEVAIRSKDYFTIKDRLDDLKELSSLFNQFESKYEECVNSVVKGTYEIFHKAIKLFNSSVYEKNLLLKDSVRDYKHVYEIFKQIEEIREYHLKNETPSPEALIINIDQQLKLSKKESFENFDIETAQVKLKNLSIIAEFFEEFNDTNSELKQIYEIFIIELINKAGKSFEINDFNLCANQIKEVKACLENFGELLNSSNLIGKYEELIQIIKSSILALVGNLAPLYEKDKIEKNDIDTIINHFEIFSNIKDIELFKEIIDIKCLETSISYAVKEYINHFNKLESKIHDIIRDKDAHTLSVAKTIFEEIKQIMRIDEVNTKVRTEYSKLAIEISLKVTSFKITIKEILNSFEESESIDFKILSNSLVGLKEGKWVDEIIPGTCESEFQKVNEEIMKFIDKIDSKFENIDLSIEYSSSIKIAFDIVNQMKSIEALKELIPSFDKNGESYRIKFESGINKVLNEIKCEFLNNKENSKSSEIDPSEEDYNEDMEELKNPAVEEEKQAKIILPKEKLVNWGKANQAFNYIKNCEEISYLGSEDLWMKFTEFINHRWLQINQNFENYFNVIEKFAHKEEILLEIKYKEAAEGLFSALDQGLAIKNKSQSIFDYLKCENTLEDYIYRITLIENELFKASEYYKHENQINHYYLCLLIFDSLSSVDQILSNKTTFLKRHSVIQNEFCNQIDETEKKFIIYIENYDFSEAEILINSLDKLNKRSKFRIISNKIQSIITGLIRKSQDCLQKDNIIIEDDDINMIMESQKNIKNAKETILIYLEEEAKLKLIEPENEFFAFLADKIKKLIKRCEQTINKYSYCDAEICIRSLDKICCILSYSEITHSLESEIIELSTRIKNLPQTIPDSFEKTPIESYKDLLNPKHIIKELEKAASRNPNFNDCIEKIKQILNKKIDTIAEEMGKSNYYTKKQYIKLIEGAHQSFPQEIEEKAKLKIKEWRKNLKLKKEERASLLESSTKDKDIEKLCQIIFDDTENKINAKLLNDSKGRLKNILDLTIEEACHALKQNDLDLALEKAAIYEHYKIINKALKGTGQTLIDKKLGKEILKKCEGLCGIITNIKFESVDNVLSKWKDFQKIVEFNIGLISKENGHQLYELDWPAQCIYSKLSDFFSSIYRNYNISKPPNNSEFSNHCLEKIREYDELLQNLKEFKSFHCKIDEDIEIEDDYCYDDDYRNNTIQIYLKVSYCQGYSVISDELNKEFAEVANYLKRFTVQDKEIVHEKIRDDRFKELKQKFDAMSKFEEISSHILDFSQIHDQCINAIKEEIDWAKQKAFECINKDDFLDTDYESLRISYSLLDSFKNSIYIEGIGLTEILAQIKNTFTVKAERHKDVALDSSNSIDDIIKSLISIKTISINFPPMKASLDHLMDKLLVKCKEQNTLNVRVIYDELEKDNTGLIIINEHKFFESEKHRLWATRTEKFDIDYVMKRIEGSNIDKSALTEQFKKYSKFYTKISSSYNKLAADSNIHEAINSLSSLICSKFSTVDYDFMPSTKTLNTIDKNIIPKLLAYLAALWTLLNIKKMNPDQMDNKSPIFLSPHPVQILSIFRMAGIGYNSQTTFANNLVQVLTGEGKSVTLGLTSAMLAILGFSVRCACYSEHLSKRDLDEFAPLFNCLDLFSWISYGTFNELCENEINSKIDIREFVKSEICPDYYQKIYQINQATERPRILLIDEVDVFFSKTFYGKIFRPATTIHNDLITNLINLIWGRRESSLNLADILKSQEFIKCKTHFSKYQELIAEAAKDMINDLNYLDSHEYIVQDDLIGYKIHDGVSFHTSYGYYTLWAYYKEHENNRISKKSLANHIGISIRCGDFSYAEMPKSFTHIMGVTGTLKTLGHHEKNIIENEYDIKNFSYMPSVFGDNNRIFRKNVDIHVENDKENYFQRIIEEINSNMAGKNGGERAVLIFFETSEKMMDFYNNTTNQSWKQFRIQIITEELRKGDRYRLINQATISGYVSLFTRVFGRGIDFKCQNRTVENSGGVHAIQTFLSEEESEETQIMGRSARQGQQGSFSMVLFAEELQKFQIDEIEILNARDNSTIYGLLCQKRREYYETKNKNENNHVKYVKQSHDRSMEFLNNITRGIIDGFKSYILEENISDFTETSSYNIIVLLQATEPMSYLLQNAKNTVGIIFKRTREILAKKGASPGSFQIKYCIYRASSCPSDLIFQASPWSNKPDILESFMKEIRTQGGKGNEAINRALKYINDRHQHEKISKVILIGDFVNCQSMPLFNNQGGKKKKNRNAQTNLFETYHEELAKVARNCIPIHGFYISPNSRNAFEEIAETTRGAHDFLDINSTSGAENLSNAICKEILRVVSDEDAVKLYQKHYEMANFSRGFYNVYR